MEKISRIVEWVTVKKALIATAFFLVMVYIIDFSPIGTLGLTRAVPGAGSFLFYFPLHGII